jgi:hypothetical protein
VILRFSDSASATLDALGLDSGRGDLYDEICDLIERIAADPGGREARRRLLRTPGGQSVWLVPIRSYGTKKPWVLLWQVNGEGHPEIAYIGPEDFRPEE